MAERENELEKRYQQGMFISLFGYMDYFSYL